MRVGAATYGPWAGIVAGAFLAVAPLDVMQVHYASVEPLLVLSTTLVMASSWWLMRRGTLRAAALAGATAGFTAGAKYPGLAFVSAVGWAIGERWWRDRSRATAVRCAAVAAVALATAFALACPSCIVHADVLMTMLERHRTMAAFAGFAGACLVPQAGWWHRPWLYEIVASLPYGMGIPLAAVGFFGIASALYHRRPADRLLLATLLPYFAYMGSSSVVYPRYMLPLFPGLALLGAGALARLPRPRVAMLAAGVTVAYGLALTGSQLTRFSWDQQAAVADWLGDRLPALAVDDRRVAIPALEAPDPYFRLRKPIEARGFQVETGNAGKLLVGRPAFFVMPDWFAMVVLRDRRDFLLQAQLQRLQTGQAGYRPVLRLPSPDRLQRRWDEGWDPTFAVELWQGALGFTVYARDDILPGQPLEMLPALPRGAERRSPDGSASRLTRSPVDG
jgi:hypothetical protein